MPDKILLTETEAAELLSVEPRTMRLWRTKRGLPYLRLTHKTVRYRRTDIDTWLARFRVATLN